jgi:hypothetical protein
MACRHLHRTFLIRNPLQGHPILLLEDLAFLDTSPLLRPPLPRLKATLHLIAVLLQPSQAERAFSALIKSQHLLLEVTAL